MISLSPIGCTNYLFISYQLNDKMKVNRVWRKEVQILFNFPVESFWLIVPWPFIWLALGIFMYFRNKRDDDLEDPSEGEVKN